VKSSNLIFEQIEGEEVKWRSPVGYSLWDETTIAYWWVLKSIKGILFQSVLLFVICILSEVEMKMHVAWLANNLNAKVFS
jgi:hypothetical protein